MNKKKYKKIKGFTLLEMLVVVGVFSIIVPLMSSLFVSIYQVAVKANLQKGVYQDVRYAAETISREVKDSKSMNCDTENNAISLAKADGSNVNISRDTFEFNGKEYGLLTAETGSDKVVVTSRHTDIYEFLILNHSGGSCVKQFAEILIKGRSTNPTGKGEYPEYELRTIISIKADIPEEGKTQKIKFAAVGRGFSLMVNEMGELFSSGRNNNGQLGLGYAGANVLRFTKANIEDVKIVTTPDSNHVPGNNYPAHVVDFTHAVKNNGELWAVGNGFYGGMGIGSVTSTTTWTRSIDSSGNPMNNVIKVADGSYCSIALKSNGTLWSAGGGPYSDGYNCGGTGTAGLLNSYHQARTKESGNPPLTGVIDADAGNQRSIALRSDGTVWIAGVVGLGRYNDAIHSLYYQQVTEIPSTENIISVQVGGGWYGQPSWVALLPNGDYWVGNFNDATPKKLEWRKKVGGNVRATIMSDQFEIYDSGGSYVDKNGGIFFSKPHDVLESGYCNGPASAGWVKIPHLIDVVQYGYIRGQHSIFVMGDGSAKLVGNNSNGQLGNGTTVSTGCLITYKDSYGGCIF
jgi:prepilin-type N-terminal cleavage/methylation domain-containing protein